MTFVQCVSYRYLFGLTILQSTRYVNVIITRSKKRKQMLYDLVSGRVIKSMTINYIKLCVDVIGEYGKVKISREKTIPIKL